MKKTKLDEAYEKIHREFDKITPTGRLSKVKSYNIGSFLCVAVHNGLESVKGNDYSKYMKYLKKCGITEDFIIDENEKMKFKKKKVEFEFIELVIDFNNQVPEGYKEPKSKFRLEEIIKKDN
ncbi:hypothetical protein [Acinetobacter bohemicus]|uniref:hypothetical protein n=1 Tax=Acinetobacter bohemicus TaxID=1435036 RepID=UPI0040411EDA